MEFKGGASEAGGVWLKNVAMFSICIWKFRARSATGVRVWSWESRSCTPDIHPPGSWSPVS